MNDRLKANSSQITTTGTDIALNFIGFLASDEARLQRFCGLSGMGEADLKAGLADSTVQGFVLDYALGDEPLLLAFAAETGLKPEAILRARQKLPGFSQ